MKALKISLVSIAAAAALFAGHGIGAGPAEGRQLKGNYPGPRYIQPFADRRAVRGYRAQRRCYVLAETRAEKTQRSIARRLCNSSIVDERAEGTSNFR
jgi:hypothetical protein